MGSISHYQIRFVISKFFFSVELLLQEVDKEQGSIIKKEKGDSLGRGKFLREEMVMAKIGISIT